ncbi:MAG: DSD1 family PLP-dependent enzyme [Pseudomonadota bacterium]|nr:DSD1 family PLP-dependent enzyme [Pseudomonadota bacterium]
MQHYPGPNTHLINIPGSLSHLSTPALILDLEQAEKNIQAMMKHCQQTGQKLRPHAKSHKSSVLAKKQMEAGAVGICCATLREAETMTANGLTGILLTSPIAGAAKINRLITLNQQTSDILAVVDDPATVTSISQAQQQTDPDKTLGLLVDLDIGTHRTGTSNIKEARALALQVANSKNLVFRGIQAYAGHLQHIEDYFDRMAAMTTQAKLLAGLVADLKADGIAPEIVTGGGTGTYDIDHRFDVFTELQAGSYLFTDVQYNTVQLNEEGTKPFGPSLTVLATVVSAIHNTHSVIDAGLKSFATDGPAPEIMHGAPAEATYKFMGDEHGAVVYPPGNNKILHTGDRVSCIVPHCDPTVNLYDNYHCMKGDTLVQIVPIDARGNS